MPVTDLPRSLDAYRRQLEIAVADDLARRRRRRLRLGAVALLLAVIAVIVNVLPGGAADKRLPAVQPASALERAAAALARDDDAIWHVHIRARQYDRDRPDIRWQDEFWVGPGAIRVVETAPDGRVVESGQTREAQQVWDGRRVLEAPSESGEISAGPDEQFRGEVLASLHKGSARVVGSITSNGRRALKIAGDGGLTYIVDAATYNPIEFRTRGTSGGTVLRFVTYERLPLNDTTRALLSIAAQHGGAPVVRDPAAYQEAITRLFPNG